VIAGLTDGVPSGSVCPTWPGHATTGAASGLGLVSS